MADREYVRESDGKFASTGGSTEKTGSRGATIAASRLAVERDVAKEVTALSRYKKIRDQQTTERKAALKAWVAEKTPKPPKGAPWQGDAKPLPGSETWDKYMDGAKGDLFATVKDPVRKELHDEIKAQAIGKNSMPPEGQQPLAILMMGGSGSGKSSLLAHVDKSNFVHIDPDGIKEKLPEYRDGVRNKIRSAAAEVHEESSYVAKHLRDETMNAPEGKQRNLIFDGTGANGKSYGKFIDDLKDKGYHVQLLFSHLPKEKADDRMKGRAEESGRHVEEAAAAENHAQVPRNWVGLSKRVDEATMFSTDVCRECPPTLLQKVEKGNRLTYDKDAVRQFEARYYEKAS